MGPNLEFCALTRGNLRVCGGSSFEDKLQNGTIIGRNACCMLSRMTPLRPVISVRSSVQNPETISACHLRYPSRPQISRFRSYQGKNGPGSGERCQPTRPPVVCPTS